MPATLNLPSRAHWWERLLASRYPAEIFARPLRLVFTFILPLVFIAYVPTLDFKDGIRPIWLLTTVGMSVAAPTAARLFWNYAMRAYTSAIS